VDRWHCALVERVSALGSNRYVSAALGARWRRAAWACPRASTGAPIQTAGGLLRVAWDSHQTAARGGARARVRGAGHRRGVLSGVRRAGVRRGLVVRRQAQRRGCRWPALTPGERRAWPCSLRRPGCSAVTRTGGSRTC
jgi:hypothetical protein